MSAVRWGGAFAKRILSDDDRELSSSAQADDPVIRDGSALARAESVDAVITGCSAYAEHDKRVGRISRRRNPPSFASDKKAAGYGFA